MSGYVCRHFAFSTAWVNKFKLSGDFWGIEQVHSLVDIVFGVNPIGDGLTRHLVN